MKTEVEILEVNMEEVAEIEVKVVVVEDVVKVKEEADECNDVAGKVEEDNVVMVDKKWWRGGG